MPEGHTLRRLAEDLDGLLAGRRVRVTSPQGRFADEAALLDGARLVGARSAGKHLFVSFDDSRLVHVHLGLIGRMHVAPGLPPAPEGALRMRLQTLDPGPPAYADLRAAGRCALVTDAERRAVTDGLGADPLDEAADPERAWARISRSSRPVGALLMDQRVVAGVGNVFRAEVLFRQGLHPRRPGRTLRRSQFSAIWHDLVDLMRQGVRANRIDSVRAEHTAEAMAREPRTPDCGGEVYVYRRAGRPCLVCGTSVCTEVLDGRNSFWCPRCQPAPRGPARSR